MKCPRCGNELHQEEAFCGQCGTPNNPTPPIMQPEEMMSPPTPRSGLLSGRYNGTVPFAAPAPPASYQSGPLQPPGTPINTHISSPGVPPGFNQVPPGQPPNNQQTGFYRDATEAMISVPNPGEQSFVGYQQQSFPGLANPPSYPGIQQYGPQAGPAAQSYPVANYAPGQGYSYNGMGGTVHPLQPAQRSPNNMMVLVISICVVVALIGTIGIISLFMVKNQSNQQAALPSPTAAPVPSPTASPTPSPTPSPMPSPTATTAPTPAPDGGFAWCGQSCTSLGFSTQYPLGWQPASAINSPGVQFTNPTMPAIFSSFKAPGATGSSAGDLVNNDLQANFANKPGYTPPNGTSTATIGGTTWITATAGYNEGTPVRVMVYSTVYQGKAFTIELQAPNEQFDAVNAQFFMPMLAKYQFQ